MQRSTYEREPGAYTSPSKRLEETQSTVYRSGKSPYSATRKTEIQSSGKKTTTIVYEGPNYITRTVIEDKPEAPVEEFITEEKTEDRFGQIRHERRSVTKYQTARGVEEVRRTVIENSPKVQTKVVYEGDPLAPVTTKSPYKSTYTRTVERSSPEERVVRTTIREDGPLGYRTIERREVSPDRTVTTRTVRAEGSGLKDSYTRTVREESPDGREVTYTTYRDGPVRETTHVTKIQKETPTKTYTSRVTREVSPGKVITRTVRETPLGEEETVTRTYREDSPSRTTYTRVVRDDGLERTYTRTVREEPRVPLPEYETRTTTYDDGLTKREITTTTYKGEDYPRRKLPAAEEDVVVLKYTSPYKGERVSKVETTTYYP